MNLVAISKKSYRFFERYPGDDRRFDPLRRILSHRYFHHGAPFSARTTASNDTVTTEITVENSTAVDARATCVS